jgi:hypothetical protein
MRIVVTGSRTIQNQKLVMNRFDIMFDQFMRWHGTNDSFVTVVHGAADGVDSLVASAFDYVEPKYDYRGRVFDIETISYPVTNEDWLRFGRSGPNNAGARRNRRMLDDVRPDVVFGFWRPAGPRPSNGTMHCIKEAASRGILVLTQIISEVNAPDQDVLL